jgi:hypothetical protein
MTDDSTVGGTISQAISAYEGLASVAEGDEDEWSYVMDLAASWRSRLEACAADRGAEGLTPPEHAAVERAIDEIGRISDPYRAVDWLSTFPQVVLTALGERP